MVRKLTKKTPKVTRDKRGRLAKGCVLNPSGINGSQKLLGKIKSVRRRAAQYIDENNGFDILIKHATAKKADVSNSAIQAIINLFVPRLKPVPVISPSDLDDEEKKALQKIIGLPPEKQAQKVIELYTCCGVIDCSIATTLNELIKSSQHIQDERIQQLLARYDEDKKA